jgi:hypothetical protein
VQRRVRRAGCLSASQRREGLLAEIERDRPMIRLVNERVFAPPLIIFGLILARGAERGEIPLGAVSPPVADLGPAMLVQRFRGDSAPIPDEFLMAIVGDLIMPPPGHAPARHPLAASHPPSAADRPPAAPAAAAAAL